ncbi:hypothetical protein ACJ41O_007792 [Fusarium nematophilum]
MDDPEPIADSTIKDPESSPNERQYQVSPSINLVAQNAIISPPPQNDVKLDQPASPPSATSQSCGAQQCYYTSTQWTADGTSLLSSSSLNSISTFVLPDDLLDPSSPRPRSLQPQATVSLPEPTQTVASAPFFSLAEPASQSVLVGCRDHPIQLYHLFPPEDEDGAAPRAAPPLASYKLIRAETEEYITPSSMLWEAPGSHFLCGSANRLDYFDMTRPGSDGPLLTIPTIPSKRYVAKGGGVVGMKGTVAALSASPADAITAAGTWTRWIGLYDLHRSDKVIANWALPRPEDTHGAVGGQGIVQVRWSPCGRYLMINERHATGLQVYDIRGTGELLSVLRGRNAPTQQRMTCDVFAGDPYANASAFEVWTGSHDGRVTVWEGVGSQVGVVEPSWEWRAHDAPVGSTALHASGSVVATCSGGWGFSEATQSQTVFDESSVKVWSIGG